MRRKPLAMAGHHTNEFNPSMDAFSKPTLENRGELVLSWLTEPRRPAIPALDVDIRQEDGVPLMSVAYNNAAG